MVLHRANKPVESLAEVDAVLAKDPANAGYRNLRAVVLCRTGDYDTAIPSTKRSCANTRTRRA